MSDQTTGQDEELHTIQLEFLAGFGEATRLGMEEAEEQWAWWGIPRHLQIAYGRSAARLCYGKGGTAWGLYYLRDLPLSVWDLSAIGYHHAAIAFEDERMRIKGVVRLEGGPPFVGCGFPVKGGVE